MTQPISRRTPPLNLKSRLIAALNRTTQDEVWTDISHVIAVVGYDVASSLCESVSKTAESPKYKRSKDIRAKHIIRKGIASFNRLDLLKALHDTDTEIHTGEQGVHSEDRLQPSTDSNTGEVQIPHPPAVRGRSGDGEADDEVAAG